MSTISKYMFNTPKDVLKLTEAYETILDEAKKNKKKKPDADGDGVPDWADKHPGKDDHKAVKAKMKKESLSFRELYASVINS